VSPRGQRCSNEKWLFCAILSATRMLENHSLFPKSRREKKAEWLMTDESVTRELAAAQKRVMRAWTKLEKKRENLISSLREIEHEMTAINPVVNALLRPSKELEAA
jgi:hypothetical protein